jgi:hypothetical protein
MLAQIMHALPPGSNGPPVWAQVLIYATAAAGFALGAWLIWAGRHSDEPAGTPLCRWKQGLSFPSRAAVGLTLMLTAYHGAAWISPFQDRFLMVPLRYWWIVAIGAVLLAGGSLLADKVESKN